jgi:hypothetical protein
MLLTGIGQTFLHNGFDRGIDQCSVVAFIDLTKMEEGG